MTRPLLRLLQAMGSGGYGGAEAFFERLARAFHRAGLAQRLLIRRHGERARKLREAGLEVVELDFGGLFDLRTGARFRRNVAEFEPDLVITWMNRATRFCPRATRRRPFVHLARLGGYYNLKYYRHCDHLIGNTEDIVRYLRAQGWPEERAHYLPNFVDAVAAPPVARAHLETPENVPLLLALGRLHPSKAFDTLIEALPEIADAHLWLAGKGPQKGELVKLAERRGVADRVRFLGWRADAPALFAAADLCVCPSRIEPLGNVVIEAWAHGVPVVAAAGAGPAALIEDGRTGLLVAIDDPAGLARASRRVLADAALSRRLVVEGRSAFEADYTEDAVVARYRAFFDRVTGECAASPG